jgi:hypothetical protein
MARRNPGEARPEDGDDGRSVAESELSVYPWVWGPDPGSELQPSTRTPVFTGARGRTPGAVVKLKDIDTIELEESESIIVKLEGPDAGLYAFSIPRSRSSSLQPTSYPSAPQPDATTGLLPPGWIMCRWDMCREIVPEASLKHHVLYSRAHANGNHIMRHSGGVELATYCLWDHCGHDRGGNIFTHVRKTHFGDHICDCCRNRFDQERQLNTHLKKLCTKRCGHCRALFATREDARAHYETRVCVPVALQDTSALVTAWTSSVPRLFRCLWAGCNAEVVSDDASIKRHLQFTHKLLTKATPSNEECR